MMTAKAAPVAQPMIEESTDPPTMRNAGRLSPYEGGGDSFGYAMAAMVLGLVVVGAMLQAVMTNHGRGLRGLALNGLAAATALAIVFGSMLAYGSVGPSEGIGIGLAFGILWLVLAIIAFAVGSLVQPPGKIKRRA